MANQTDLYSILTNNPYVIGPAGTDRRRPTFADEFRQRVTTENPAMAAALSGVPQLPRGPHETYGNPDLRGRPGGGRGIPDPRAVRDSFNTDGQQGVGDLVPRPRETFGNPDLRDRGQGGRGGDFGQVGIGVGERAGDPRAVMHELNLDGYQGPPDGPVLPHESFGNPDLQGRGQGGRGEQAFDINQYGPQNPPSLMQFLNYMEGAARAGTVSAADISRAKLWFGSQPGILEAVKQAAVGRPVDWKVFQPVGHGLNWDGYTGPPQGPPPSDTQPILGLDLGLDKQRPGGGPRETFGNPDLRGGGQGGRGVPDRNAIAQGGQGLANSRPGIRPMAASDPYSLMRAYGSQPPATSRNAATGAMNPAAAPSGSYAGAGMRLVGSKVGGFDQFVQKTRRGGRGV